MKKLLSQRLLTLAVMLMIIFSSSCNRGYGCPTNFSVKDFFADLLQAAASFIW